MKYLLPASILATSLLMHNAYAAPTQYSLDPYHTNVVWHANHFGFSTPSGKFTDVKGTLMLDEKSPADSKLDIKINTASVMTGIEKFDQHLKNKDFFKVEQFPEATFVSKKVEITGKDMAKVHGTLTLLNIPKDVTLNVKLNKIGISPITQKQTAGFSAETTLKRSDFGMTYALPGVSDEVKITIEVEAIAIDAGKK